MVGNDGDISNEEAVPDSDLIMVWFVVIML